MRIFKDVTLFIWELIEACYKNNLHCCYTARFVCMWKHRNSSRIHVSLYTPAFTSVSRPSILSFESLLPQYMVAIIDQHQIVRPSFLASAFASVFPSVIKPPPPPPSLNPSVYYVFESLLPVWIVSNIKQHSSVRLSSRSRLRPIFPVRHSVHPWSRPSILSLSYSTHYASSWSSICIYMSVRFIYRLPKAISICLCVRLSLRSSDRLFLKPFPHYPPPP